MKYLLNTFLIFINLFIFNSDSWCDVYNFRHTKWGMTLQQVKESEKLELSHSNDNLLVYKTNVLDKNVYVVYVFVDDKLVRATYGLAEEHTNNNDYILDYKDFQNILIKKYGKPATDDIYWKNDLYKKDQTHWGNAIGMGHLLYFSTWETEDTKITCFLHGDNFSIKCGVEYVSKQLASLEKKQKEKKSLESF